MTMSRVRRVLAGSIITLISWAGTASAQAPPPSPPAPAGPLVLEPMHNGFVLAPEVKITRIDRKAEAMVGGYGGWIKDDHLLIGGGAYGTANRKRGSQGLLYGGLVVGWFFNPEQRISVSARTLAGVGRATETVTIGIPYCLLPEEYLCSSPTFSPGSFLPDLPGRYDHFDRDYRVHTTFFAEPEVSVVARVGGRIRLTGGVGYRLTADRYRQFNSASRASRGPSGSFSVQFNF
jgi:hypothetical protein